MLTPYQPLSDIGSILRDLGFPVSAEIRKNGKTLGTICIDFRPAEDPALGDPETIKRDQFEVVAYLNTLQRTFLSYDLLFRFNYELAIDTSRPYFGGLALFYLAEDQAEKIWAYVTLSDEQIFKNVKKWGPIALRSSMFFYRFDEWINDEEIAGKKLNQLRNALVEFVYDRSHRDSRWKQGRGENDLFRIFGTEWIREMYRDLALVFRLARRRLRETKAQDIYAIIEESFLDYFTKVVTRLKAKETDQQACRHHQRVAHALEHYKKNTSPNPIAWLVAHDDELCAAFMSFDDRGGKNFEPNMLAKRTLARLFGISESRIIKLIERPATATNPH